MQDILIAIFFGVIIGAVIVATAFVRHCKNTAETSED